MFATLGKEEQGHVDYLEHCLKEWKKTGKVPNVPLKSILPKGAKWIEAERKKLSGKGKREASKTELDALKVALKTDATVISVGNTTAEHPGSQLILRTVEPERSAAYTSSHVCAMTALAQVATVLGEQRGTAATSGFRAALTALPGQIADVLARQDEILPISKAGATARIYAAGSGPNEATALELVIKAREAAYVPIDALHAEQFLHGPMVAFNEGDLLVAVNVAGNAFERVAAICSVANGMGGKLWVVGSPEAPVPEAAMFALPELPEMISPLLAVVPMQMLAYTMAALRGMTREAPADSASRARSACTWL